MAETGGQRMTEADRIRKMSDYELCEFLTGDGIVLETTITGDGLTCNTLKAKNFFDLTMRWLKQEVVFDG
jgi:hypothetical protein